MDVSINILHFNVHSLSNNANINFGPTYQNSHTATSKIVGGNYQFGDNSSLSSISWNSFASHDEQSKESASS